MNVESYLEVVKLFSPNKGRSIKYIVIHGTGKKSIQEVIDTFTDPSSEVSCHYLIDIDGSVYQFVGEEEVAWHAGISCWKGEASLNYTSIGIELFNPSAGSHTPYSSLQYEKLSILLKYLMTKYGIKLENILGHSDIAPERRTDPGVFFDWNLIKEEVVS